LPADNYFRSNKNRLDLAVFIVVKIWPTVDEYDINNINHKRKDARPVKTRNSEMESYRGLPPPDARLWHKGRDEKIPTPLNTNGLADLDKLVIIGKEQAVKEYDWTSPFNDVHHLQWPGMCYDSETEHIFRELVQRKTYIPRVFHNWLHHITLPPPLPSEEVMRHTIQAEQTARAIASTAQLAVRLTRMANIPEDKLLRRLEQEFDNYMLYVENAREVPVEFRLLKLNEVEANSVDEMLTANRRLGKLALNHIPVRNRELYVA